jgi:hypothetical protein
VVECAGRGRWLSDTNDGLLATGLRKNLSSMSRLLWLSQTQTQTTSGAGRGVTLYTGHFKLQSCFAHSVSGPSGALPTTTGS